MNYGYFLSDARSHHLLRNLLKVHNEFKTCYGDMINCVCIYIQWKDIEVDLHKHSDRLGYVTFFIKGNYARNKIFEVYLFKRQNRLFIEFTYWVNIRSAKIYHAKIYYAKIYYAKIYYAKF